MKVLSYILMALSALLYSQAKPQYKEESGQYVPDNSGQYVHDDSGRYIPDRSGDYVSDGLGLYTHDGNGNFLTDRTGKYRGNENFFRRNDIYKPEPIVTKTIARSLLEKSDGSRYNKISSANLLGSGSTVSKQTVNPVKTNEEKSFGNLAASTSPVATQVASASKLSRVPYEQGRYSSLDGKWKIIRQDEAIDDDGYHWEFETENGITAQETGKLANKGTDKEGMKAKGFYQYTGPDNVVYLTGYTADENGFVAVGNHLPTPPPIPIEILKSLEHLKSLGKI